MLEGDGQLFLDQQHISSFNVVLQGWLVHRQRWCFEGELEESLFIEHMQIHSEQVGHQIDQGDAHQDHRIGAVSPENAIHLHHNQEFLEIYILIDQIISFHGFYDVFSSIIRESGENIVDALFVFPVGRHSDFPRV